MNRTILSITILSLTTLIQVDPLSAQGPWGFEFHANGGISTQDDARDTHENGFGFGATVQYRFLPHLAAYTGWDYSHFSALPAIAGPDMDLEETGYVMGLRFEHPFREGGRTSGWLRGGATYNHLELEDVSGDIVADSGHGWGWDFGAGIALPLGNRWNVTPGIRYRSISRDLEQGEVATTVELQHVSLEVGFGIRF